MWYTAQLSRRSALGLLAGGIAAVGGTPMAAGGTPIRVFKDPSCGCCDGWVEHLAANGFTATVTATTRMQAVKSRLGVPDDLASCHTAEVGGYVIEGHVPAVAIKRLLSEQPAAIGLSAPGMPIGSPGMEGGTPEVFEVVMFGRSGRSSFGRYRGSAAA